MIVRELITRMGFGLNQASLNNVEKGTQRVKDRANEAAAAFRNVVTAFASIATVRSVLNIADEMQNIRSRLAQLPQTVGDVTAAFDELGARASASGMSIEAYSSLYTRVGNAAKDYIKTQEDLLGITDTISQALVVGGASAQEASAVMTQFSQALASGVLQGDEFRSMAEAAPQYLDKLSEAMGIPREQLKKMASEGKLTAKAVIEATRTMSNYFGDKFKQMPMTVGRAMTVIGNRFGLMIDRINRDTNFVTIIANKIIAAFDVVEAGILSMVKAFGGWENAIRFVGIAISVAFGAKALSILSAFRMTTLLAMLPFLKMVAIITLVSLAVEDLYLWIKGGESLTGSLIGPWAEWAPFVMGAVEAVTAVFRWFGQLVGAVAAVIVSAFTLDANLFTEGLKGIGELLWQVVSQWGKWIYDAVFSPIVNAVRDAWNAISGIAGSAWDNAKSFVGMGNAGEPTGGVLPLANTVGPAQMAGAAMGRGAPSIQSNTTVKVTVPAGTSAEQAAFLERTAQEAFKTQSDNKLARDLSVYAP